MKRAKWVLATLIYMVLCMIATVSLADQVVIPSGTTTIEAEAFYGDQSLTDVVLPEGLLQIGSRAFANTSLKSVVLPSSLEYFAEDSFGGCPEGFRISVYSGSKALELCTQYGIQPKIIGERKVGISIPRADLIRWHQDGVWMEEQLTKAGYKAELQFADNDLSTQLSQVEAMIDDDCEVIIIAPVDGTEFGQVLKKAADKGVRIISYDRLLTGSENVDYYTTFNNEAVGTLQGNYVKNALKLDSAAGTFTIEFTAGDSGDSNAARFYSGAINVLKPYINSGKLIVKSGQTEFSQVSTSGWSPANAQRRAKAILNLYYTSGEKIDAWLCSNDSTALGVTDALKNNYTGAGWPIITGQDCDIDNVKNIIAGKQAMSVFKDTRVLAEQAAKMAMQILRDKTVDVNDTESYNNGKKNVPTFLCEPTIVDVNNYRKVLINSGIYSEETLAGGAPEPNMDEPIRIGIIHLDPDESGYREANVRSLKEVFTAENGYDATFVQASYMDDLPEIARGFIDDGVDYIAACPMDTVGWDGVLQEAKAHNIPVFFYDRTAASDPSLYTASVVTDIAEEGKTAVAWLESLNLAEYRIIHIQGIIGSDAQIGRSAALNSKAEADSKWTIVRQGTGGYRWEPEKVQELIQSAIDAGESFNIIYAESDSLADSAAEVLDAAGITHGVNGDVIIMGFDCNKWALRKLLNGEWNYDGQCSPFQAPYIDKMIKTLEAGGTITGLNEKNEFITPEIGFDARTITQEDIDKYGLGD